VTDNGAVDTRPCEASGSDKDFGSPQLEYPMGAVQALTSGAIGLLAILVAFIAYADFRLKPDASWSLATVPPIGFALCAAVSLAFVPFLATRPQQPKTGVRQSALHTARLTLGAGAGFTILAITWFVVRALVANHT
jgi:hypothetical protein